MTRDAVFEALQNGMLFCVVGSWNRWSQGQAWVSAPSGRRGFGQAITRAVREGVLVAPRHSARRRVPHASSPGNRTWTHVETGDSLALSVPRGSVATFGLGGEATAPTATWPRPRSFARYIARSASCTSRLVVVVSPARATPTLAAS
jgi:hypothetical protein